MHGQMIESARLVGNPEGSRDLECPVQWGDEAGLHRAGVPGLPRPFALLNAPSLKEGEVSAACAT